MGTEMPTERLKQGLFNIKQDVIAALVFAPLWVFSRVVPVRKFDEWTARRRGK